MVLFAKTNDDFYYEILYTKVGDYVMVVPDESGQHFFIVDILRGVS